VSDPCASKYRPSMYRWQVMDLYDRSTRNLAANLVIAAALTRAYRLGDYHGWESAADQCSSCAGDWDDERERIVKPEKWWPNTRGVAAP
jgi:hypothetical protein